MKPYALLLLCIAALCDALVARRAATAKLAGFGVHTEFIHPVTGATVQMLVKGYTGPVQFADYSNTTFAPTRHYLQPWERNLTSELEKRNVCQYIANCVENGVQDALTWTMERGALGVDLCMNVANSLNNYLTANNYANANAIILGSGVTVVWTLVLTPAVYYINAALDKLYGGSNTDSCGVRQPPTYSGDAASALYEWCLAIQGEVTQARIATRYAAADLAYSDAKDIQGGGDEAVFKFYIAEQADTFAEKCSDMGVVWRRPVEARAALEGRSPVEAGRVGY